MKAFAPTQNDEMHGRAQQTVGQGSGSEWVLALILALPERGQTRQMCR
jgi:hypothetical protein